MVEPKTRLRISEFQENNKPRERLFSEGLQALSDGELLAILLGSGTIGENAIDLGNRLLKELGGFSGIHRLEPTELLGIHGVGEAKAARIKAALELGVRLVREPYKTVVIRSPEDVERLYGLEFRAKSQEELWVLGLNVRNHLIERHRLYKGSQDSSSVRVSELFKIAVTKGYYGVILIHNHPSGDATESPEDVNLTQSVIQAGEILDIRVLDHIIIGLKDAVSIKNRHPSLWTRGR